MALNSLTYAMNFGVAQQLRCRMMSPHVGMQLRQTLPRGGRMIFSASGAQRLSIRATANPIRARPAPRFQQDSRRSLTLSSPKPHLGERLRSFSIRAASPRQPLDETEQSSRGRDWYKAVVGVVAAAAVMLSSVSNPSQAEAFVTDSKPSTQEMQMPQGNPGDLDAAELASVRLFQQNTPSVVNISNIREVRARQGRYGAMDIVKMPVGAGSGFIWDTKGHIVTNNHVIQGADDVQVALIDQSVYNAKVVGGDADKDVAVLQLLDVPPEKLKQLKPVTLGTSSTLLVGQRVFAIGNPFGLDHTLTQGIVSGVGREIQTPGPRQVPVRNVIQTDAAINPGNSGGVLLDSRGRLIGINTAIADPSGRGANSGVGFAIPIDAVKVSRSPRGVCGFTQN